jgi:hypothetical protein
MVAPGRRATLALSCCARLCTRTHRRPAHGIPDNRGLIAGLTYRELNMPYAEAFDLLSEVDQSDLVEWEADLKASGQSVRHSNRVLSVLDTIDAESADSGTLRSLHFNDRLDYVQSCVRLDAATGQADHSRPPPTRGETGTVVSGLALAVATHSLLAGPLAASRPLRVAVIGAGACALPAFLHSALPRATIEAVEVSAEVCAAARAHFGVAELEASDRFRLVEGCGFEWLATAAAGSTDVLIVDMEAGDAEVNIGEPANDDRAESLDEAATGAASGGGQERGPLLAPPRKLLEPAFVARCAEVLAPGGVLALNALGSDAEVRHVAAQFSAFAACSPPASVAPAMDAKASGHPLVQRFLFCAPDTPAASARSSRESVRGALRLDQSRGVALVESAQEWLDSWVAPMHAPVVGSRHQA